MYIAVVQKIAKRKGANPFSFTAYYPNRWSGTPKEKIRGKEFHAHCVKLTHPIPFPSIVFQTVCSGEQELKLSMSVFYFFLNAYISIRYTIFIVNYYCLIGFANIQNFSKKMISESRNITANSKLQTAN